MNKKTEKVEGLTIKLHSAEIARAEWRVNLKRLPMLDEHKSRLTLHWQQLHDHFKIVTEYVLSTKYAPNPG